MEASAALLGIIKVILIIRRSVWNYPFGLAMVVLYGFVFFEAKLYSDTLLQIYFFVVQLYGWWNWLHGLGGDGRIEVGVMTNRGRLIAMASIIAASLLAGWLMTTVTDAAAPFWHATVAGFSVVAQFLLSRRKLESWMLWIIADVVAVALFASRGLYVTGALHLLFLALAVAGLVQWWRAREAPTPIVSRAAA
jgi:nicotinamide mononucleotide transporter